MKIVISLVFVNCKRNYFLKTYYHKMKKQKLFPKWLERTYVNAKPYTDEIIKDQLIQSGY